jgi:hypothetical protein
MKIIITEEQFNQLQESDRDFNKTKNLVNSMYDEDKLTIDEIVTYTGLDKKIIITLLYDHEIINDEEGECQDKNRHLYRNLWGSGLINREYKYQDGSFILITFENMSGSLNFQYTSRGYELRGYATLMWNDESELPIEPSYFYDIDGTDYSVYGYIHSKVDLSDDIKFNNIKTFRQLVDYFNNDYYTILKKELDSLLEECIEDHL